MSDPRRFHWPIIPPTPTPVTCPSTPSISNITTGPLINNSAPAQSAAAAAAAAATSEASPPPPYSSNNESSHTTSTTTTTTTACIPPSPKQPLTTTIPHQSIFRPGPNKPKFWIISQHPDRIIRHAILSCPTAAATTSAAPVFDPNASTNKPSLKFSLFSNNSAKLNTLLSLSSPISQSSSTTSAAPSPAHHPYENVRVTLEKPHPPAWEHPIHIFGANGRLLVEICDTSVRIYHADGKSLRCLIMRVYGGWVVSSGEVGAWEWEKGRVVPMARLVREVVVVCGGAGGGQGEKRVQGGGQGGKGGDKAGQGGIEGARRGAAGGGEVVRVKMDEVVVERWQQGRRVRTRIELPDRDTRYNPEYLLVWPAEGTWPAG